VRTLECERTARRQAGTGRAEPLVQTRSHPTTSTTPGPAQFVGCITCAPGSHRQPRIGAASSGFLRQLALPCRREAPGHGSIPQHETARLSRQVDLPGITPRSRTLGNRSRSWPRRHTKSRVCGAAKRRRRCWDSPRRSRTSHRVRTSVTIATNLSPARTPAGHGFSPEAVSSLYRLMRIPS